MEDKVPVPSKGYQKQIKHEAPPPPKREKAISLDYSSPTAKKWPRLVEAIEKGKVQVVKELIEEGINVNVIRDGITPLMIAASKGQTEIAELILQAGVNINEKSDDGWTALHKAAFEQPEPGVAELLLNLGIDIAAKNKNGKTALQLAEEKKHREVIRVIKQHQQKLQAEGEEWEVFLNSPEGKPYKQSRLHESLQTYLKFWWLPPAALAMAGLLIGLLSGSLLVGGIAGLFLGILIVLGASVQEKRMQAYLDEIGPLPELDIHTLRQKRESGEMTEQGADEGSVPAAAKAPRKKLLQIVIPVAAVLIVALAATAVYLYKDPMVRWYYAKKIERSGIAFTEQSFLDEVSKNNEEAMALFLKAGIKIDAKNDLGQNAVRIACEKGYVNTLGMLARLAPAMVEEADRTGTTALMAAARQGRMDIVKALLENGADVNHLVPSALGPATALQAVLAVPDFAETHLLMTTYLLEKSAHARDRNGSGRFPLLFAAEAGRIDAAKLLIEHGADVNDFDPRTGFPLMTAACTGHSEFIWMLAEKGANLKMASSDGYTPLMCASKEGRLDAVRVLIERGAEVSAATTSGLTALTEATKTGNVDMARMLLQHGADPARAFIPDDFIALNGWPVTVNARNKRTSDLMKIITKIAAQDGYTVNARSRMDQKMTMTIKAPWNKVLVELAKKNRLVLMVKEKEIIVLP